jgi:hypothetical protein
MLRSLVTISLLHTWTAVLLAEEPGGQADSVQRPFVVICSDSTRVCTVSASGAIAQLPIHFQPEYGAVGWGSSGPIVSPDGRWIAFARFADLFLFEVSTSKTTRIAASNATRDSISCDVFLTDWSLSSKRLLYFMKDHEIRFESYGRYDCPADGFFVYNLEARTTDSMPIPGLVACWLPDGRVVIREDLGLLLFTPGEAKATPLMPPIRSPNQVRCSPDGDRIVMQCSPATNEGQIVELNWREGAMRVVTPIGKLTQWQWPTYSPSGKSIAVLAEVGTDQRVVRDPTTGRSKPLWTHHRSIWVDGAEIISHSNISRFTWVNDSIIAFCADDSAFVVTTGGQLLARRGF